MKRVVTSAKKITNNYLNELFKKIDWDDVDYADNLINQTIKKELGVSKPFDQAKYINMLDKDTRDQLMALLEDPAAIHQRRMKNRKVKKPSGSSKPTVLSVKYEDYPDGRIKKATFEGTDRLDALKKMTDSLGFYIESSDIEDNGWSADDVIEELWSTNGDGCDFIIELKDKTANEILMDAAEED